MSPGALFVIIVIVVVVVVVVVVGSVVVVVVCSFVERSGCAMSVPLHLILGCDFGQLAKLRVVLICSRLGCHAVVFGSMVVVWVVWVVGW